METNQMNFTLSDMIDGFSPPVFLCDAMEWVQAEFAAGTWVNRPHDNLHANESHRCAGCRAHSIDITVKFLAD